jgi:hypothetical protein
MRRKDAGRLREVEEAAVGNGLNLRLRVGKRGEAKECRLEILTI